MINIAAVIKAKRRHFRYTVDHIADRLEEFGIEISPKTVYNWENDHSQPTPEILLALCKIYEIDDVLLEFGVIPPEGARAVLDMLPIEEQRHLREFRKLNEKGKEKATGYVKDIQVAYAAEPPEVFGPDNITINDDENVRGRELPLYTMTASAGVGVWAGEGDYELISVTDDVPASAGFGVRISGNSMEPNIPDGSIVWVKQQPDVNVGEVCIAVINGEGYCKVKGKSSFHSINPEYRQIRVHDFDEVKISGKVIYVQNENEK